MNREAHRQLFLFATSFGCWLGRWQTRHRRWSL